MKDGATQEFVQAYNAQAVVDSHAQVIVGVAVTQEANDKQQWVPRLEQVQVQMGSPPPQATADAGYFSEQNVTAAPLQGIDLFVVPDRQKHGEKWPRTTGPPPLGASVAEQMRHKLRTPEGQAVYKRRKAVVEPVFGQIKEARGFRRFRLRGLAKVQGGMEADLRHAQSAETVPVRMEPPKRMKQPAPTTQPTYRAVLPESKAQNPTPRERGTAKGQNLESLSPTHS